MNCHLAVFIAGKLFDNSFVATGVVVNRNSFSHSDRRIGLRAPVEALISWDWSQQILATLDLTARKKAVAGRKREQEQPDFSRLRRSRSRTFSQPLNRRWNGQ